MASHVATVNAGNNKVARDLYVVLNNLSKGSGNVFFSPISLHTIVALLHQGAEGDTEASLRAALGIPEKANSAAGFAEIMSALNSVSDVTLEMANKVYVKSGYKMKPDFLSVATKSFFAEAADVDFAQSAAAAKTINTWVEQKTKDKIKDLISPDAVNADTRMVLVNAIYFKGNWADQFEPRLTETKPFHLNSKEQVDCQMMFKKRKYNYKEDSELDAKVLQIPYKNPNVSFVAVLPNDVDGISKLEEKLKDYDHSKLTENMMNVEVEVSLPKFKVETSMDLTEPLKKIGFSQIMRPDANLQGLLDSPESLYVSKVIQKAFIEVNEEGAEAAAATGMMVMMCCMPMDPLRFTADHPFLYFIRANNATLFMGKLATTSTA